jgi:hypothetical protein
VRFRAPSRQGGNADRAPGIHEPQVIPVAWPRRRPWAAGRWRAAPG